MAWAGPGTLRPWTRYFPVQPSHQWVHSIRPSTSDISSSMIGVLNAVWLHCCSSCLTPCFVKAFASLTIGHGFPFSTRCYRGDVWFCSKLFPVFLSSTVCWFWIFDETFGARSSSSYWTSQWGNDRCLLIIFLVFDWSKINCILIKCFILLLLQNFEYFRETVQLLEHHGSINIRNGKVKILQEKDINFSADIWRPILTAYGVSQTPTVTHRTGWQKWPTQISLDPMRNS